MHMTVFKLKFLLFCFVLFCFVLFCFVLYSVVIKVFSDVGAERAILQSQVKCLNSSKGCKWTGELSNAQRHTDACPLDKVKCRIDNCEEMIERRNEEKHRQEECLWRKMTCRHCDEDYAFRQKQHHMDTCRLLPIDCRNGCGHLVPRMRMAVHINEECPLTIVECPYSATGCKVNQIKRYKLQEHLAQSTQSHLDVTWERQQEMHQEIKRLRNELEIQLQEMKDLKKGLNQQEAQLQEEKERLNEQERQLQEEKKRLNEQLKETKDVKDRQLYRSHCHGVLIWRINHYEQRLLDLQADTENYMASHPFYSGRYGYKLRCFVKVKESYLRIYIQILRGEFDALLPWPFSRKVTFTLINQTRKNSGIVMSLTSKGLNNFQRPNTEFNVGRGFGDFAKLETIKNGGYLNNNEIFIKVEVEPFDLLGDK